MAEPGTRGKRIFLLALATLVILIVIAVGLFVIKQSSDEPMKILPFQNSPSNQEANKFDDEQYVQQYIYDCYSMEPSVARTECYEKYYFYKNPEFKSRKDACLKSSDGQTCLDKLYHDMAFDVDAAFCRDVIDENLRKDCELIR